MVWALCGCFSIWNLNIWTLQLFWSFLYLEDDEKKKSKHFISHLQVSSSLSVENTLLLSTTIFPEESPPSWSPEYNTTEMSAVPWNLKLLYVVGPHI